MWDLNFYISNKFTGGNNATGLQAIFWIAKINLSVLMGNQSTPENLSEGLPLRLL